VRGHAVALRVDPRIDIQLRRREADIPFTQICWDRAALLLPLSLWR
jgi:hypothetical protein